MNPFEGQRRLEVRAEQVVWHLVSAGVLGLLLLALVASVSLLDGANEAATPVDGTERVARPVSEESEVRALLETSQRCEPAVPVRGFAPHRIEAMPVALPVRAGLPLDGGCGRPSAPVPDPHLEIDA